MTLTVLILAAVWFALTVDATLFAIEVDETDHFDRKWKIIVLFVVSAVWNVSGAVLHTYRHQIADLYRKLKSV